MSKLLKIFVVVLLAALLVLVQFVVLLSAFRVTSNSGWEPVQLLAFVFDGMFILAVLRFLRRKPAFSVAASFIFLSNLVLFYLALVAREAFTRLPGLHLP